MKTNQINVTEIENKDDSVTYKIEMPTKQLEVVNKVLTKEGYTFESYFKAILEELVYEENLTNRSLNMGLRVE